MSLAHDPQNCTDYYAPGRCPVCRTFDPELLFYGCTCCPTSVAHCQEDGCDGRIERTREVPRSHGTQRRLREIVQELRMAS